MHSAWEYSYNPWSLGCNQISITIHYIIMTRADCEINDTVLINLCIEKSLILCYGHLQTLYFALYDHDLEIGEGGFEKVGTDFRIGSVEFDSLCSSGKNLGHLLFVCAPYLTKISKMIDFEAESLSILNFHSKYNIW